MSQRESAEDLGMGSVTGFGIADNASRNGGRAGVMVPDRVTIMLVTMIVLAVISQFFRSSNGVVAPILMEELTIDAAAIGLSSGAFFVIFAVLQIPIGVLFDRYGARTVVSSMLIFAVLGSVLFALAESAEVLVAGRFLIGLGFAGGMVGSLVILSRWHSPSDFTRKMAILFAAANLGSLFATSPLAAATDSIGWRATFLVLAVATALVGMAFYLLVKDAPAGADVSKQDKQTFGESIRGVGKVFKVPGVLCVMPMIGLGYASIVTIIGLWGAPYLEEVHGLESLDQGNLLAIMAIAFVVGTLAYGPIQRQVGSFRRIVFVGGGLSALLMIALALVAHLDLMITLPLLVVVCFIGAFSVVLMGHGISLIPSELVGRGTTTLNGVLMGGTAILQIASGVVVEGAQDFFGTPASGYAAFFAGLGVLMLLATALYMRAPEPAPKGS